MPVWTANFAGWYFPSPASSSSTIGSHTIKIEFDCQCGDREDQREPPEVDLETYSSKVANVRVTKSVDTSFGEDRVTHLAPTVRVRKANCTEGPGFIVWIEADGEFNTQENPPPYLWENWGARGAWRICCCCDQITGETSWSAVNVRKPRGGVTASNMFVRLTADEKPSCDDEVQRKRYTFRYVAPR